MSKTNKPALNDQRLALKCGGRAPKERAARLVAEGKPFCNSNGSFFGVAGRHSSVGRLTGADRERYRAESRIRYTVVSWDTPIAWLRESGEWVVVADRFSASTTQHQSLVRLYFLPGSPFAYNN